MSDNVDQLRLDVDIAFQTITALSDNTDRAVASINASIQRQDRILDYLMAAMWRATNRRLEEAIALGS